MTSYFDLYLSRALLACFDGDGDTPPVEPPPVEPPAGKTFTQDDVNKMLAEDRRKHQAQLKVQEEKLQNVLKSATLTEQDRKALQDNLSAVQGQLRSKEQQAALEKQELEQTFKAQLEETEKKAQGWESLYRESTIQRELHDAATQNEAFRPRQIINELRPMTKLIEDTDPITQRPNGQYKVVVEMPDVDPKTGKQEVMVRTPGEAVKRMKELPDQYGNLFKSGVVSGIGAGSATGGLVPGQSGRVDVSRLTPQQYRELREKNPEALGLAKRR